jgi:uncharacterized protein (DUF1330 family)
MAKAFWIACYRSVSAGLNQRTAMIEFDGVQKAIAASNGEGYDAALKALQGGAERDIRIVESAV